MSDPKPATLAVDFGWLPLRHSYATTRLRVQPLPDFDDRIAEVKKTGRLDEGGGWFYPPLVEISRSGIEVPASTFALPSTHRLEVDGADDQRGLADLAIAVIGMVQGVRLVPEGWWHLYRAAVKPRAFGDLLAHAGAVQKVLAALECFWQSHTPEVRARLFGAVHWYVFGHCYQHQFECFNAQYTVLDTLFKIDQLIQPPRKMVHAKRPAHLAQQYGLIVPSWAVVTGNPPECELSKLRNDMVHEARYAGAPIGFAHPKRDLPIDHELALFNCRLLLALIGVRCRYVRSAIDLRSPHGLDPEP